MDVVVVAVEDGIVEVEFIDLEDCARQGRPVHRAKSYRIVIDRTPYTVHRHEMTGTEILALVGKVPDAWSLTEKLPGGKRERIEPHQVIVFHHHAIERFETSPNKVRNGEAGLRDPLTDDDRAFLDGLGYTWRTVRDGGAWAVVVEVYRLPAGLVPGVVDLMVRVPTHYPDSGLDMFNLRPPVARGDGRPLELVSTFSFLDGLWQQWSRHRLPENPWNGTTDGMATHFGIIESALARDAA